MDVFEAIQARRSIRTFTDRAIEREKLEKILEAGRAAPIGCNLDEVRFIVIRDPEEAKMVWSDIPVTNAVIIVICYDKRIPHVVGQDTKTGEYVVYDCSPESPKGRTSLCYDREALDSRKEHKPKSSAMDMAAAMGADLLTEEQYQELQRLGAFDTKSSSWLKTPADIRKLGGAIFGDRRFGRVFVYHNGAESYYSGRGFRGWLRV
jgi:hypothetical protein